MTSHRSRSLTTPSLTLAAGLTCALGAGATAQQPPTRPEQPSVIINLDALNALGPEPTMAGMMLPHVPAPAPGTSQAAAPVASPFYGAGVTFGNQVPVYQAPQTPRFTQPVTLRPPGPGGTPQGATASPQTPVASLPQRAVAPVAPVKPPAPSSRPVAATPPPAPPPAVASAPVPAIAPAPQTASRGAGLVPGSLGLLPEDQGLTLYGQEPAPSAQAPSPAPARPAPVAALPSRPELPPIPEPTPIEAAPATPAAPPSPSQITVRAEFLAFPSGGTRLEPAHEIALTKVADQNKGNTGRVILIAGSSDGNSRTALSRALAVRNNLIAHGIAPERIDSRVVESAKAAAFGDRVAISIGAVPSAPAAAVAAPTPPPLPPKPMPAEALSQAKPAAPEPAPQPSAPVAAAQPVPLPTPRAVPLPVSPAPAPQPSFQPPSPSEQAQLGAGDDIKIPFSGTAVEVPADAKERIAVIAEALKRDEGLKVVITANGTGATAAEGRRIALARAYRARDALMGMGVNGRRISLHADNEGDGVELALTRN